MSLPVDAAFAPDLSALLAPLPGADPTGESLRYAPVYAQIRDARFEEDQNLPMGEWTRPLKRADWQAMETLCVQALSTRTKDLQVAGWLTEAWTRRHGLAGLLAGQASNASERGGLEMPPGIGHMCRSAALGAVADAGVAQG